MPHPLLRRLAAVACAALLVLGQGARGAGLVACPHHGRTGAPGAAVVGGGDGHHASHYHPAHSPGSPPEQHDGTPCTCSGSCQTAGAPLLCSGPVTTARAVATWTAFFPGIEPAFPRPALRPHVLPFATAPPIAG